MNIKTRLADIFEMLSIDKSGLDIVWQAALDAGFTELIAAIETYQERYTPTDEEWSDCQEQAIKEELGDYDN